MLQRVRGGFTLIEILLVVAIIAILAVIVFTGLNLARSKARDAARITDLKTIASALEFYYDDTGHYPVATGEVTTCGHAGANWIPDGTNYAWSSKYISSMPRDPAESCGGGTQQTYTYQSDGKTYQLTTTLENPSPPSTTNQSFAYNGSYFEPVTDTSPIGVSISSPVSNPTNESPIPIVVTFSRDVIDFSQSSLSILSGFISGFSEVLATVFNVFVTPTDNNTVVVSVSGGAAHDQNGVGNAAAQFTVTYDSLLPHVALSPDPLPSTVSGPFSVSANFTVAVVDFSAGSVSVANGSVTNFAAQNGSNYTFTIVPTSHGTVSVSVLSNITHSAAGNGNVASNVISTTY